MKDKDRQRLKQARVFALQTSAFGFVGATAKVPGWLHVAGLRGKNKESVLTSEFALNS